MNFSDIKKAKELKSRLDQTQKELSNTLVEANAGKGAVKVVMDGQQRLKSIEIATSAMDPDKAKLLENMIIKAVNDAINKSQKAAAKQLKAITGGMKIPGLM